MKAVTCFIILMGAGASVLSAAQPPASPLAATQASSAPLQVASGALQISSAPIGSIPEDHGTLRGYKRVVENGHERYCRNDVGTGSHLAKNPACLTYKQLQIEQARAQEFLEAVHRQGALGNLPTNMNGMGR